MERMERMERMSSPPAYRAREEGVTIVLRCPRLSSLKLWLAVYLCVTVITSRTTRSVSRVQAGIGISLSSLWVIGHLYVLSHTSEYSLREQRSVSQWSRPVQILGFCDFRVVMAGTERIYYGPLVDTAKVTLP